jgi:hypothetical protein
MRQQQWGKEEGGKRLWKSGETQMLRVLPWVWLKRKGREKQRQGEQELHLDCRLQEARR